MTILPPSGLPGVGETKTEPVAGSGPFSNNGISGNAAQTSFPSVLAQANQQGASPKPVSTAKEISGNATPSTFSQAEEEGAGSANTEGAPVILSSLIHQPVESNGGPQSSENVLDLASQPNKVQGELNRGNHSRIILASETPVLTTAESGLRGTPGGTSLLPSAGSVSAALQGEVNSVVSQISSIGQKLVNGQNPESALQSKGSEQLSVPPLTRDPSLAVQPGTRLAVPSVPLSFLNPVFPQGQPLLDSVNTSNLSPAMTQNVQGPLFASTGSSHVTIIDGTGNSTLSVAGDEGRAETGGSSLGSDQRSGQEHGAAFANKHQTSGHAFGGFALHTEGGNESRVSESQAGARTDMLTERARAMNILSPQRMQMEVMLSDETKVQIEVAVKQQQVTAQLLTDQMMLRNLAIQYEPQLEAQLSSAGLDLQQFGAEVSEQGLFGQHLSDSSSRKSFSGNGEEASVLQEAEMLVAASVEADGRLHYVA